MGLKAKDVRIGNYFKIAGEIDVVTELETDGINSFADSYCEPIPLTEEWLIKFGFTNGYHLDYIKEVDEYLNITINL